MRKKVILLIALILSTLSSLTVYYSLTRSEGNQKVGNNVSVIVAAKEISPKERITRDHLAIKEIPQSMIHFEAARNIDQVVGYFARERIIAGEQILKSRLIKGFDDFGIVIKIPPGHRAITVPVDEVVGVAGFIRPGDYVDVIASFEEMEKSEQSVSIILEKVQVLAIDQDMDETNRKPSKSRTVTLSVTPDGAKKLALAIDYGAVRLALRPIDDPEVKVLPEVVGKALITENQKKPRQSLSKLTSTPRSNGTQKKVENNKTETEKGPEPNSENPSKKIEYLVEIIHGSERSFITVVD